MIDDKALQAIFTLVVAIGALNWAFVSFFDVNVLVDTLSLAEGSTEYQAVVGIIGASAVVRLYTVAEGWA